MANEEEANLAHKQHRTKLLKMGVHAIGIEEGRRHSKDGWVVVAHISQDAKVDLPAILIARKNKNNVTVPLVVTRSEPFKPE